jgi:hypothetical protein
MPDRQRRTGMAKWGCPEDQQSDLWKLRVKRWRKKSNRKEFASAIKSIKEPKGPEICKNLNPCLFLP